MNKPLTVVDLRSLTQSLRIQDICKIKKFTRGGRGGEREEKEKRDVDRG